MPGVVADWVAPVAPYGIKWELGDETDNEVWPDIPTLSMVEFGNELNPGDDVEFDELGEFGGNVFDPNDTWCCA